MENITFLEVQNAMDSTVTEYAVVAHDDGSFTTMPKSLYEAQQAEQSTPIVIDEAKTK
jgi:hypothetical protein